MKSKFETYEFVCEEVEGGLIEKETIVRCGECRYMLDNGRCSEFADDAIRPSVSDFCSYGKPKEQNE